MNSRERSPSTDKWDITYIEFQYLVKNLCLKIMESGESFDVISPVMRGGMAPALWISHILNIPVRVELEANKKVLVLDDVGDTGKTLRGIERTHTHLDYKVIINSYKNLIFNLMLPATLVK